MRYSLDKYKYFTHKTKRGIETIAISTYGGKTVKGKAICNPDDTYDEEKGKKLAAMRCNLRIANKRRDRAAAQYSDAVIAYEAAYKRVKAMEQYYNDAFIEANEAISDLTELLDTFDN